jgi:[NiFe] hydrogenase diaphorase moiety large subunit
MVADAGLHTLQSDATHDPVRRSFDAASLNPILARHKHDANNLLQILIGIQELYGYIPPAAIDNLITKLQIPRVKIEGMATFYSFLHLQPHGEYRVLFSDNITDRMLGSAALLEQMGQKLWIEPGKVSEDGLVSMGMTSCTGMCDQGPALLINNLAITHLTSQRVDTICDLIRNRVPVSGWPAEFFVIQDNIRRKDVLLDSNFAPGAALSALLARGNTETLDEIKVSRLRGRGGAGYSTGAKWEACRNAPGAQHYVVCNADEGEPGTFKDRVLLTRHADTVIEGMTLCARIIGAKHGFIYLRGEYRYLLEHLQQVLQRRREQKLLGKSILDTEGFDFDIDIHLGAGAYICGEESALIESLEGKRGTPRNRPPFPVTHGYLNQPTVVNNVETFAATCLIALRGGAWHAAIGTTGPDVKLRSSGTKLLSVSGDCERPGIYEYPFGTTVAQVLADCGARNTLAVQVSGPAGVCVAENEFERRIAFEDLPTAGAFMVFDRSRDMFEVARNFVHFFAHESCGFCTPCRVGTSLLKNMLVDTVRPTTSPRSGNSTNCCCP